MRRLTDTDTEQPSPSPVAPHDASPAALSADEFALLMRALTRDTPPPAIALAVSGGPDSMALARCMRDWATPRNIKLTAFIIDHALRDASAAEAEITQTRLATLDIPSEILRWDHDPVVTKLHVRARAARYALLTGACHAHDIKHLMTAHHRDDQAETILMRLAKGSGIDGLAGMAADSVKDGVHIWRPFLSIGKDRLVTTCNEARLPFIRDASNDSGKFARGRLRHVLPLLAEEGLTVERLIDLGQRAAAAKEALDHATREFLKQHTETDASGALYLDAVAFRDLPQAIAERALTYALRHIHPQDYAPEHASLDPLCAALRKDMPMPTRTLQGCLITKGTKRISLLREVAAIAPQPISPGEALIWDNRWRLTLAPDAETGLEVRPLGAVAHDRLEQLAPRLAHDIPQGRARAGLPALWKGEAIVGIVPLRNGDDHGPFRGDLLRSWPPEV